jgi:uncharacterized repeat protein (TIGR01451 family)
MNMKIILTLLALSAPIMAVAENTMVTKITPFIEKTVTQPDGKTKLVLQEPSKVFPGDKIVYVLSYHNGGAAAATNFAITDPIPQHMIFDGTPDASALVSVDGGKSWGNLATLKVGTRAARPEDVTHVRWALASAIPAGADGKLSFRGTVK